MSKFQFDTHIYETQISGVTVLQKVYEVYVVYKQGSTGFGCDTRFIEKNECTHGISVVSIQFTKTVGININSAHGGNVLYANNRCSIPRKLIKKNVSWLGVLCKMCDVRVCIVLMVMVAIAFIAVFIAILIMMN